MKTKPKSYKWPVYVSQDVQEFMTSIKGVGAAFFRTAYHNPQERRPGSATIRVYWFRTRNEALNEMIWLIDWYYAAAKPADGVCRFANYGLWCGLTN